jgi:endogenous inhibitor of DNA gyrase (YacG/DUF329 family)
MTTASPRCPICRRPAEPSASPFCSRRCADLDLGRWLTAHYAIPGQPVEPTDEDLPPG